MFKNSEKKRKNILWPSKESKFQTNQKYKVRYYSREDSRETKKMNVVTTADKTESQRIKVSVSDELKDDIEALAEYIHNVKDKLITEPAKSSSGTKRIERDNKRKASRRLTCMKTDVWIYQENGSVIDSGEAVVRNISTTGALVTDLKLQSGAIPVKPFKIHLTLKVSGKGGVGVVCKPVRFTSDGYGVRFEDFQVTV